MRMAQISREKTCTKTWTNAKARSIWGKVGEISTAWSQSQMFQEKNEG